MMAIHSFRWFSNSGILLFLNKTDLLEAKLQTTSFADSFADYHGANTMPEVQQYLLAKFKSLYRHQWRELFPHFTCATGELSSSNRYLGAVADASCTHRLLADASSTSSGRAAHHGQQFGQVGELA